MGGNPKYNQIHYKQGRWRPPRNLDRGERKGDRKLKDAQIVVSE